MPDSPTPPPLPVPRPPLDLFTKLLVALALLFLLLFIGLSVLWGLGYIRPYRIPTGSMAPAINPGDQLLVEGLSLLASPPQRGEIVVFNGGGIVTPQPRVFYVERVAGLPGDHVRLTDDKLFINDQPVTLHNAEGKIKYFLPRGLAASDRFTDLIVPADSYFVLGDNSANSYDSRYWGCVPRDRITGRIVFRYAPAARIGTVE